MIKAKFCLGPLCLRPLLLSTKTYYTFWNQDEPGIENIPYNLELPATGSDLKAFCLLLVADKAWQMHTTLVKARTLGQIGQHLELNFGHEQWNNCITELILINF